MRKLYRIGLVCLCVCMFFTMSIFAEATSVEDVLGERTTAIMIEEMIAEINKYSTITNERIHSIIENIANTYGVELTEEQFKTIYEKVIQDMDSYISDDISLWDQIKIQVNDLRKMVEETFPSVKDKEVTVTVPRISQVDALVNEGIYYFIRNILPLITS